MSNLTFKRIALGLVATLGLGVISSGPSSAVIASSDTLTVSANTLTVAQGETGTVTISASFISGASAIAANNGESLVVNVLNQSAPAAATSATTHALYVTDSRNVNVSVNGTGNALSPLTGTSAGVSAGFGAVSEPLVQRDFGPRGATGGSSPLAYTTAVLGGFNPIAANTSGSVSFAWRFIAPNAAGTYVFRVYLTAGTNTASYSVVSVPQTITVTVTANASTVASPTFSRAFLNRAAEFTEGSGRISSTDNHGSKGLEVDSALVVTAGSTNNADNSALAVWTPIVENASDTKVATVTTADGSVNNLRVKDSVVVTMTGPGLLAASSYWTGVGTTRSKQVTINWNESVVVYADGSAGVGTITGYISSISAANKFAQAAKTITFVGRATTFTVSGYSAAIRAGGAVRYAGAADSATAAAEAIRFLATDAAGNAVTTSALSVAPGEGALNSNNRFFAISSDTSVIAAGEAGATYALSADRRSPALPCTYDSTSSVAGYWYCTGRVFDSGTVTLTIVDSRTVTPNGANYLTSTDSAVYKSAAFSVTFAGNGNTGTIAFNKASYNINEAATLTLTCKDGAGRVVADGQYTSCFSNLSWKAGSPAFGEDTSANSAGGRFTNLITYLGTTGPSFVGGTDTALVFMPTIAGTYTLQGRTGTATTVSDLLTFTVVDPAQVANAAAIAASQAAADAATDAALEAIDAANAATDAANLAAEAADAATVAAEEARDAADAATAAVEALATEVASMMAALKAQITTLARTVAKIAKKVNA